MNLRKMWVMALPANILLAVTGHVDFLDVLLVGILFVMASSAEFPIGGTGGNITPRVHIVLFWGVVATGALHVHMFRKCLCPCDVRMAGLAFFGGFRGCGIVRVVARYARLPWIVRGRYDLWKTRRPRGQVLVAERTVASVTGGLQLAQLRVIRMFCCGAVTDFTAQVLVIARVSRVKFVLVTVHAHLGPGVLDFQGGRISQGGTTVVAVLPKIVRHKNGPAHQQRDNQKYKQKGEAFDLLRDSSPNPNQFIAEVIWVQWCYSVK
jgi:hypothetical protein